jgi:hypothetical protein
LLIVFLLQGIEPAQSCIPFRFEGVGDQAMVGIDLEIAPTG